MTSAEEIPAGMRMDVVPGVLGSGKRYFGSVHGRRLLGDPDVLIRGNRVLTCAIGTPLTLWGSALLQARRQLPGQERLATRPLAP